MLGDGATKIFLSTKGTADDVDADVKAFLDYVESGIVSGEFAKDFDTTVNKVKFNERTVKEFMTYEMALLESRMEGEIKGEIKGAENIAIKMLTKGVSLEQIQEFTDLSIQRIKELAQKFEDKKEDV